MVQYKIGLFTLETGNSDITSNAPSISQRDTTKSQRVAKSAAGDVGVYPQGPDLEPFTIQGTLIATTPVIQTIKQQSAALRAEVLRKYPVLMQGDDFDDGVNTTGRAFVSLDRQSQMQGQGPIYRFSLGGVVLGYWNAYRRRRRFRNVDVTTNYFGLPGAYELTLPSLDGALAFVSASSMYTSLESGVSADLNLTGIIEIEAWGNQTNQVAAQTVISKNTGANDYNFNVNINTSGFVIFKYTSSGPTAQVYTTSSQAVTSAANQHIYVTFNFGTGSTMAVYVNGGLAAGSWTSGNGNAAPLTTAARLRIGADGGSSTYMNGNLWDVKVGSPAAQTSAVNIMLSFRRGHSILDSTTKGLWPLNEWVGTTNYDATGLNDLTMVATPTFTGGTLGGATPSETIDYFRRTSYGVVPVVYAPAFASTRFDCRDYDLLQDAISVTRSGNQYVVHNGFIKLTTRDDQSTNKGRLDVNYWNLSAWSTTQSAALYGEVKSTSGSVESFTDTNPPSVYVKSERNWARIVLSYPSTTTNGYSVKVAHVIRRGCPLIKTEVYSAGQTLTTARLNFNVTGTSFTNQTQLGATVLANSGALGTPQVVAGDADSNSYNYIATANPWATTAVAMGWLRAKKVDCDYVTDDAGTSWDYCGLQFDNVSIEENQAFPAFYWFIGRQDCLGISVANMAQVALRDIAPEDDVEAVT